PKDSSEAANWFRKAAEQGDSRGQELIGWAYYNGVGVETDYVLAYKWVNLAAAHGDTSAKDIRETLEKTMRPERIAEAQRLSCEFKPLNCAGAPNGLLTRSDAIGTEKPRPAQLGEHN